MKKELILYLVDTTRNTELELTNHITNYEYSLLSLENKGNKIYFEFESLKQIDLLIDKLNELQTHLISED